MLAAHPTKSSMRIVRTPRSLEHSEAFGKSENKIAKIWAFLGKQLRKERSIMCETRKNGLRNLRNSYKSSLNGLPLAAFIIANGQVCPRDLRHLLISFVQLQSEFWVHGSLHFVVHGKLLTGSHCVQIGTREWSLSRRPQHNRHAEVL